MQSVSYPLFTFCLLIGVIMLSGCGAVTQARKAADRQQQANNLKQVGMAYHRFHDKHRRGPDNWEELQSEAMGSPAIQVIRNAGYEVFFGIAFKDINIGTSNCIMAHKPADVATGGDVLTMDGAVMPMSADELKKALELRATVKKS